MAKSAASIKLHGGGEGRGPSRLHGVSILCVSLLILLLPEICRTNQNLRLRVIHVYRCTANLQLAEQQEQYRSPRTNARLPAASQLQRKLAHRPYPRARAVKHKWDHRQPKRHEPQQRHRPRRLPSARPHPFLIASAGPTSSPRWYTIARVNNGKHPPTRERMSVFAAMALLANWRYTAVRRWW